MRLELAKIRVDGGTQARDGLNLATVEEYAEAMIDGAEFPPCVAFYDGATYWMADGFHRHAAASKAGRTSIDVDVRQGDRRAAVLHSVGANDAHGLRRTNADKRRAVLCLLSDPEWSKWSDREIARRCGVGHPLVGILRRQLESDSSSTAPEKRRGADGKERAMPRRKVDAVQQKSSTPSVHDLEPRKTWPEHRRAKHLEKAAHRDKEILRMHAEGEASSRIASRLGISTQVVQKVVRASSSSSARSATEPLVSMAVAVYEQLAELTERQPKEWASATEEDELAAIAALEEVARSARALIKFFKNRNRREQ